MISNPRSAASRRGKWRGPFVASLALAVLAMPACIASSVVAHPVALGSDSGRIVTQAAKAQLVDGSIVTLPQGFHIDGNQLVGSGWRFTPTLHDSVQFSAIPRDSVAGVVTFGTAIDAAKSVGMSAAAVVTIAFLLGIALVATCAYTRCLN